MSDFHNNELNLAVKDFNEIIGFESRINFPLLPLLFFIFLPLMFGSYFDLEKWIGVYFIGGIISSIASVILISKYLNDKSKEYANYLKQLKMNANNK